MYCLCVSHIKEISFVFPIIVLCQFSQRSLLSHASLFLTSFSFALYYLHRFVSLFLFPSARACFLSLCIRAHPLCPSKHPVNSLFDLLWSCRETQVTALKSAVTAGPLAHKRSSNISQTDSTHGRERKALLCC